MIVSAVGFALSYPHQHAFWGGLATSGCLAALIGGLADWFAVTALFRRPLGISYRTQIIPRNKERLLREIVEFTSTDLLNPSNIMKIVARYDMAQMLILYLEDAEGEKKVKVVAHTVLERILETMDKQALGAAASQIVATGLRQLRIVPLLKELTQRSQEKAYDDAALRFLLQEVIWVVRDPSTARVLTDMIEAIKAEYESNFMRRQVVSFLMDLSPAHLAQLLQDEIVLQLEALKAPEHPLRLKIKAWLCAQMADEENLRVAERCKERFIEEKLDITAMAAECVERFCARQKETCFPEVDAFLDRKIAALKADVALQCATDARIKSYIGLFVHEQHALLTQIIQDRLNEFSDASLVEFVESRIADDLQMIRINGSLVGSLVGMLLYIVTYLAERMW